MAVCRIQETAAATAVGTNLMLTGSTGDGQLFVFDNRPRQVRRVGVTGSSAANNAAVAIYYGATKIGTFGNTTSGAAAPLEAKDFVPVPSHLVLLPGEPLGVVVATASATTAMTIVLEIAEL